MDVSKIIAELDEKIASLQQARAVLVDLDESTAGSKPRRGRPKGSANLVKIIAAKTTSQKKAKSKTHKRTLSPEGRKRIAEAMTRRWAERRKETPKAVKKVAVKTEVEKK